jgi:hypothetical protein
MPEFQGGKKFVGHKSAGNSLLIDTKKANVVSRERGIFSLPEEIFDIQ